MFLNAQVGDFIYREDIPEAGKGHSGSLDVNLKPTTQLQLSLTYQHERLSAKSRNELFYDGYIVRGTLSYQFTSEVFLRLISEYSTFDRNVQVYPLLSYKLNPFTIFYFGSTQQFTNFDHKTYYRHVDRQYFMKFQYLFRT
jgi:outer membrane receptor for ferrienterochelin and colicin